MQCDVVVGAGGRGIETLAEDLVFGTGGRTDGYVGRLGGYNKSIISIILSME